MITRRPSDLLRIRGAMLRFDEESGEVRVSGNRGVTRVRVMVSRREVTQWLEDWAMWFDRDREIAIRATERWRSAPAIREAFELSPPRPEWSPPWIRRIAMPLPPRGLLDRLATHRLAPVWLAERGRQRRTAYQRRHSEWIAAEEERWADIREESMASYNADQQWDQARQAMRASMDRGEPDPTVTAAVSAALAAISPLMVLRRLDYTARGTTGIEVGLKTETISDVRYKPAASLESLIFDRDREVRTARIDQLSCMAALALGDFVGMLRSERRQMALSIADEESNALLLSTRFAIGTVVGAANYIVDEIGHRRLPRVPGWLIGARR